MRILIVDDDREDTEVIAAAIRIPWPDAEIYCSVTGETGLELVTRKSVELAVLNLTLPDITGFEFLKRLSLYSALPIIALKRNLTESDVVRSLQLGADECLAKPINQLEFIAKTQAVLRRYLGKEGVRIITAGTLRLDFALHRLYFGDKELQLTRCENLLMSRLIHNHDRITSYSSIAQAIWGDDYPGYSDTIRAYLKRIRQKLTSIDCDAQIVTERGVGCRLVAC
ncbi:MAG: response regulator transcription factor [Dehalogenimonas sp.]